jgi:hypothetical protein
MLGVILWIAIVAVIRVARKMPKPAARTLCTDCASAHVQFGANGKRAIACTFGGGIRPVAMSVLYCTDYCNRSAPKRKVAVGFVPVGMLCEPANATLETH